jgi:sec-independent protein translocase protein TatB
MDLMGMGPLEIIVILVIALAIFGPQRMAEISRSLGKAVREFRKVSSEFTRTLTEEVAPEERPVKEPRKIDSELTKSLTDEVPPEERPVKEPRKIDSELTKSLTDEVPPEERPNQKG